MGVFSAVGPTLNAIGGVGGAIIKAGVHGVIGGALSVAQGGSFLQGFAGSAAGALGGYLAGQSGIAGEYGDGIDEKKLARALISGAAGCAGAAISGGKCAQAAVTSAFGSLYNADASNANWFGKLFLGTDAEATLRNRLIQDQPNAGWSKLTVFYADWTWGFVDLFNASKLSIYEVKPLDGMDDGSRQLQKYSRYSGYNVGDAKNDIGTCLRQVRSNFWVQDTIINRCRVVPWVGSSTIRTR
jgi:hypothetical protein